MPDAPVRLLSRRRWLQVASAGATLAFGAVVYAWRIEPHWVTVRHVRMPLKGLPSAIAGRRLVQISDLHVGPVVDNAYLRGVLRRLDDLAPDYVAITGDFVTTERGAEVPLAVQTLRDSLIPHTPTFAVLGNHDYGPNYRDHQIASRVADGVRSLGVEVLRNGSVEVDGIQFIGCDDLWAGRCDLYRSLHRVDNDRPAICLAHNPDTVDEPHWTTFGGWVLSGHTHGGQCRFPLLGRPILPIRNRRYAEGHVAVSGGRNLYVNRGLGYKARVRFGVRPEVTVFTLETA